MLPQPSSSFRSPAATCAAGLADIPSAGLRVVIPHAGQITPSLREDLLQQRPATVWLTGAFHEDGLADVADGLGGSAQRERALEIMKDSRIGAFGAIALVLALGLKVALLTAIALQGVSAVVAALFAGHVLSRLAPLFLIRFLPYVGDSGASKSKPLADAIGGGALAVGILWSIPAAAPVLLAQGAMKTGAMLAACALAALWMARLFRRRLQGFTGDGLGATQQVCELAVYAVLAWRLA